MSARDEDLRATKRLRSSEPDLLVIVKHTNDEGPVEKSYSMYGSDLAKRSNFVDIALSVSMQEQATRQIVLHDVSPVVFELALKFEEDSLAIRSMTIDDAMLVVGFYDKFEFRGGLQLCDQVFMEFFKEQEKLDDHGRKPSQRLDVLVKAMVIAEQCSLQKALEAGVRFMNYKLNPLYSGLGPFGCTIFTVKHIKQLQPLLVKGVLDDKLKDGLSPEQMKSSLYPEVFVHRRILHMEGTGWLGGVQGISIEGSGSSADGRYEKDEQVYCSPLGQEWGGQLFSRFQVERNTQLGGVWTIVAVPDDHDEENILLWTSPHSSNLPYPPRTGWLPEAHGLASGNFPTIEYISEDWSC